MDDFLVALIAVFVILGILMAASVYFPYYPDGLPDDIRVIKSFSAGTVGFTENYVSRVQNFESFWVGKPEPHLLKGAPRMEISSGALFGLFGSASEEFDIIVPDYVIEWNKGGEITFTVADTNEYNNLVILWNGAEIYNDKAYEGEHSVDLLPSQIKEQNTLQINALGAGLAFWASTAYTIRDFEVNALYGPAKFFDFAVSQGELETLDTFELTWYTASRRGELSVEINGEEIYRAYPERDEKVLFTDADLVDVTIRPGNNRLIFKAYNGSFELDDVILNTHVSMARKVVRERFDLDDSQLSSLKERGLLLKLYVESMDRSGTINLKINEQSAGSATGKQGWNNIRLSTDALESGSNWLEISSNGAFEVSEGSIELA
jgi:hypothetical protein